MTAPTIRPEMPTHVPNLLDLGAGCVLHDQACAVCHTGPAVLNLANGVFEPCWDCKKAGWEPPTKPQGFWARIFKRRQ